MPEAAPRPKRIFSYDEALALMPEVRQITEAAVLEVERLQQAGAAVQDHVNQIVSRWAEAVMGYGIEVKGRWLVDFDNGSGYYCWRYPESGLQFYHSYEDGFRGRVRIH